MSREPSRPPDPVESRLLGLSCSSCETAAESFGACARCGQPLLCRYAPSPPGTLAEAGGAFRWASQLPVRDAARRLELDDAPTPVVELPGLARSLGLAALWVKDEGRSATGSGAGRCMAVSVAAHAERAALSFTAPVTGPEGVALAALVRRHELDCRVILPSAASASFRTQARLFGARVIAVGGDLAAAEAWVDGHPGPPGDRVVAPFREPFGLEGAKTLGFEILERFAGDPPDVIVVPTGSGLSLVGVHLAFAQAGQAGLDPAARPRLLAAQVESCAPVVRALAAGAEIVAPWETTRRTLAESLRVPRPFGGRLILRALRESGGLALAVTEPSLVSALRDACRLDAVPLGAEGGVALAALQESCARGEFSGARALVLNPTSIHASAETLQAVGVGSR